MWETARGRFTVLEDVGTTRPSIFLHHGTASEQPVRVSSYMAMRKAEEAVIDVAPA